MSKTKSFFKSLDDKIENKKNGSGQFNFMFIMVAIVVVVVVIGLVIH